MEATLRPTRKKIIDIPEDVFLNLSIKAASYGTNLKKYIETLLEKDAEDMEDNSTYAYLSKTKPEGHVMVSGKEKKEFEEWLGVKSK